MTVLSGGSSESSGRSQSSQSYDPSTLEVNRIRKEQLQGLVGTTGGLPALDAAGRPLTTMSPTELGFTGALVNRGRAPLMSPFEGDAVRSYQDLLAPGGMDRMLAAGQDQFARIAAPTISNQATVSGFGRSGAALEALARGGAEMTLPIFNTGLTQRANAANALMGFGETLNQRELERLNTGLEAAGMPRLSQYQSEVGQPLNLLMQLLTGMPTLGPTTQSTGRQSASSWNFGICWTADALYGEASPQALLARYWVSLGWQGPAATVFRAVYSRVGRALAKGVSRSRFLRHLVRPVFDSFVRKGRLAVEGVA